MCGIAGIMMKGNAALDGYALAALKDAMLHRGPDEQGQFVRRSTGLVVTRLAIMDVANGHQPIVGSKGSILVANGEIYNAEELGRELGAGKLRSGSDCEVAVELYERGNRALVDRLRGMYALAILDRDGDMLTLLRDQFGIKPLYYTEAPELFAFASEPQALIAAGLVKARVNTRRRAELLQLKYTTGADTIWSGIRRLRPGERLIVQGGVVTSRSVREPDVDASASRRRLSRRAAVDAFGAAMESSLGIHLRSEVPLGLFLSGGVDSSILLTMMQRASDDPVRTITIGYPGSGADEREAAANLSATVGADSLRIEMNEGDFWRLAPRVAAALDDPTSDAASLPTYMLGEAAAAAGLKVMLSGEGADELFGGYSRYRRVRWRPPFLGPRTRRRGVFPPGVLVDDAGWAEGILSLESDELRRRPSRLQALQALDRAEWLPNDLLTKLDRTLMAHGVEGRTPFLDREVLQFAESLPDGRRIRGRFGKIVLRDWLAREMPSANPYAKKKGFRPPVGRWIADRSAELIPLVREQPGIREAVRSGTVASIIEAGAKDSQRAWSLVYYALWHSHHVLRVDPGGTVGDVLSSARRAG